MGAMLVLMVMLVADWEMFEALQLQELTLMVLKEAMKVLEGI